MEPIPYTIEEEDREHLMQWAEKRRPTTAYGPFECAYRPSFGCSFDEAGRCQHTYERAGEVPTVYAHVTSKYPSGWIGNLSHDTLYSEPLQLIRHESSLIREANFLALFEAAIKTLYSVEFIKYCFCLEHSIVDMARKLSTAEHPIILRAWGKWGVMSSGKFYYSKGVLDTILLWLQIIKNDYGGKLMKSFNITNLINQCVRVNKQTTLDEEPKNGSRAETASLFEVCL